MLKLQTLKDFKEAVDAIDPSFDDALVSFNNIDFYSSVARRGGQNDEYEDFDKCILRMRQQFNLKSPNSAQSEFLVGPLELFNQPEPTGEVEFTEAPEEWGLEPGILQEMNVQPMPIANGVVGQAINWQVMDEIPPPLTTQQIQEAAALMQRNAI
jgi:hypothetical protein